MTPAMTGWQALAFGLMDEPVEIDPEFICSFEERAAGFRILTRTDPIAACTPAPSRSLGREWLTPSGQSRQRPEPSMR